MMRSSLARAVRSFSRLKPSPARPPVRYFSVNRNAFEFDPDAQPNSVVVDMIKHATSLARGQKTEESYFQGLLVLDQCESIYNDDDSKGLVELARCTLLFEREDYAEVLERLEKLQLKPCSVIIKVAACEAIVGSCLEVSFNQETTALNVANLALHIIGKMRRELCDGEPFQILEARLKAAKGLIELVLGNVGSAQSLFEEARGVRGFVGNKLLSYGESLHGMRNFSTAKEMYKAVIWGTSKLKDICDPYNLGACNMTKEEVAIAATCSLGQLEAHMGNFDDADKIMTAALKDMKERFGPNHPRVGVMLTCIGLMYRLKATAEGSSSLLIQEGLFRRAIELLKPPPLFDIFINDVKLIFPRKDIAALARGGYADTLCVQESRKEDAERLREWSEKAWSHHWMSLGVALDCPESSPRVPVIDTRICRVV